MKNSILNKKGQISPIEIQLAMIHAMENLTLIQLENEKRFKVIEGKVDELIKVQKKNIFELNKLPLSQEDLPDMSVKNKVIFLIDKYCATTGIRTNGVWKKVYESLLYRYHIDIKSYKKITPKEPYIDVAERIGCMNKIYAIVSKMAKQVNLDIDFINA